MTADRHYAPVFVVGHLKSGTTLLQSLLDGHPELFVLPLELKFFKSAPVPTLPPGNRPPGELPGYRVPTLDPSLPLERIRDEVLSHGDPAVFLERREVMRNVDLSRYPFDEGVFRGELERAEPESLRELYLSLVEAFHAAAREGANGGGGARASGGAETRDDPGSAGRPARDGAGAAANPAEEEAEAGDGGGGGGIPGPPSRFVEKTPQQEEFAEELAAWFPEARFLHVLRNPYAVVNSLTRDTTVHRSRRHRIYRPMAKSFYFLERNLRYLERYRAVRYEDVVSEPEATMREVAEFLGIGFADSLLRPTFGGRPWRGNPRSVEDDLRGIDPRPVDAFREQISPLDVALVNRFFSPFLEKHGYERLPDPGARKWLPLVWELPTMYVHNRALLFTNYL